MRYRTGLILITYIKCYTCPREYFFTSIGLVIIQGWTFLCFNYSIYGLLILLISVHGHVFFGIINNYRGRSLSVWLGRDALAYIPVGISAPQVVKIGDNIYVGGGIRRPGDSSEVFKYIISQDSWQALPPCPTYDHGLATWNEELVAIGGVTTGATNKVYTFREADFSYSWGELLPSMRTPRFSLSTVTHKNQFIIAAGGTIHVHSSGEVERTNAVEVYSGRREWHTATNLPFPRSGFQTVIVGDVIYALGGAGTPSQSRTTVCASLEWSHTLSRFPLYIKAAYHIPMVWHELRSLHPLLFSSPVALNRGLVAMGGSARVQLRHGTRLISIYEFSAESEGWAECVGAQLPVPLYRVGVVKIEEDKVMIVGGQFKSQQFSATVFIGSIHRYQYTLCWAVKHNIM